MPLFFTPGPARLYPTVPAHLQQALAEHIPSISHRSKAYERIHRRAVEGVKALFAVPEDFEVFFFSSATEIWERLLQNCLLDTSYHYVNGAFSDRFFQIAEELRFKAIKDQAPWGEAFNWAGLNLPANADMIHFTHNETSTGVMLDLEGMRPFRGLQPQRILTLDIVSSAPYAQPDWHLTDAAYFSVQKGFGLPAGLGVLILGPRALARAESVYAHRSTGSYHSFRQLKSFAGKQQTPETPNVLAIYLLGAVAADMLAGGMDALREATRARAQRLYGWLDGHSHWKAFVKQPDLRSDTVIVVEAGAYTAGAQAFLEKEGWITGEGYGKLKPHTFRIANFPSVSMEEVEGLIDKLDRYAEGL